MAIFRREPPNGGVESRWFKQAEIAILSQYLASLCTVKDATGQVLSTRRHRTTVLQFVTPVTGSKRRSLLTAGDDDKMFMTRSLSVMPKKTEQHLIACTDKSVAYITNNKRLLDVLYG